MQKMQSSDKRSGVSVESMYDRTNTIQRARARMTKSGLPYLYYPRYGPLYYRPLEYRST